MGYEQLSAKALRMRLTAEFAVEPGRLSRPSRRTYRGIGLLANGREQDVSVAATRAPDRPGGGSAGADAVVHLPRRPSLDREVWLRLLRDLLEHPDVPGAEAKRVAGTTAPFGQDVAHGHGDPDLGLLR
jgi:hypothetical protein